MKKLKKSKISFGDITVLVGEHHGKGGSYKKVRARLVGGPEGVFACWTEGDIIYLAGGDDGNWWEIGHYHKSWIHWIGSALIFEERK